MVIGARLRRVSWIAARARKPCAACCRIIRECCSAVENMEVRSVWLINRPS